MDHYKQRERERERERERVMHLGVVRWSGATIVVGQGGGNEVEEEMTMKREKWTSSRAKERT